MSEQESGEKVGRGLITEGQILQANRLFYEGEPSSTDIWTNFGPSLMQYYRLVTLETTLRITILSKSIEKESFEYLK